VERGIVAVIVSLLLFLPLVAGATLKCPAKAPANKVVCGLEGNGTGKLYLKSVDGIHPRRYLITINDSKGYKSSAENYHDTFKLPANVSFQPSEIVNDLLDDYFYYHPAWIVLNKEHTFTFALVMENGAHETFNAPIYLEGRPDWHGFKETLKDGFVASLLLWLILVAILGMVWLVIRRHRGYNPDFKSVLLFSAGIPLLLFELYFLGPALFGIIYYYWGSGAKLLGDVVFGGAIWALLMSLTVYVLMYFLIPTQLGRVAYLQPLAKLKKQKLMFCSGLAWIPVPVVLYIGIIYPNDKSFALISLIWVFAILTHYILERIKPEGILFINLTIAGFLALTSHPDVAFLIVLVVLFFMVYPTQRKCFNRFNEEKERLIVEIEEKVRRIEGAGG